MTASSGSPSAPNSERHPVSWELSRASASDCTGLDPISHRNDVTVPTSDWNWYQAPSSGDPSSVSANHWFTTKLCKDCQCGTPQDICDGNAVDCSLKEESDCITDTTNCQWDASASPAVCKCASVSINHAQCGTNNVNCAVKTQSDCGHDSACVYNSQANSGTGACECNNACQSSGGGINQHAQCGAHPHTDCTDFTEQTGCDNDANCQWNVGAQPSARCECANSGGGGGGGNSGGGNSGGGGDGGVQTSRYYVMKFMKNQDMSNVELMLAQIAFRDDSGALPRASRPQGGARTPSDPPIHCVLVAASGVAQTPGSVAYCSGDGGQDRSGAVIDNLRDYEPSSPNFWVDENFVRDSAAPAAPSLTVCTHQPISWCAETLEPTLNEDRVRLWVERCDRALQPQGRRGDRVEREPFRSKQ